MTEKPTINLLYQDQLLYLFLILTLIQFNVFFFEFGQIEKELRKKVKQRKKFAITKKRRHSYIRIHNLNIIKNILKNIIEKYLFL